MNKIYMVALSLIPRVGRKTIQKIYLQNLNIKNDTVLFKSIVMETIEKYDPSSTIDEYIIKSKDIIDRSKKEDIEIITILDDDFPDAFKTISDYPVIINLKGDKSCLYYEDTLAIIGTRNPTELGKKIGYRIGEIAAKKGFVVISGLAIGSDTAGLLGCVESKGKSISVMPGGLDKIYPKANTDLAKKIISNKGCLVSEYYIGVAPNIGSFIERDRLQTALSKGIFVVETDIKGGTMHAVNEGIKTGLIIGCYNHSEAYLNFPQSRGNQMLISEKGALPLDDKETLEMFFEKLGKTKPFKDSIEETIAIKPTQLNIFN